MSIPHQTGYHIQKVTEESCTMDCNENIEHNPTSLLDMVSHVGREYLAADHDFDPYVVVLEAHLDCNYGQIVKVDGYRPDSYHEIHKSNGGWLAAAKVAPCDEHGYLISFESPILVKYRITANRFRAEQKKVKAYIPENTREPKAQPYAGTLVEVHSMGQLTFKPKDGGCGRQGPRILRSSVVLVEGSWDDVAEQY